MIQHVERAEGDAAVTTGRDLYLAFTVFLADDLRHMSEEEQQTWPLLCSLFTDNELLGMEQSIAANYGKDALLYYMPHLAAGANPKELAERLVGLKTAADWLIAFGAKRR